jgi:putative redox protein
MADKPQVTAELIWSGDLRFGATTGTTAILTDGDNDAGPSPVQLLAVALAGCMAADIVDILRKGRHPLRAFRTTLTGARASEPPRRLTSVHVHFHVHGEVPAAAIERAIALSRDKYCSVWASMRQDIDLSTAFDVLPA